MKHIFFDTHCHLDFLEDPEYEITSATRNGVRYFLLPSVGRKNFQQVKSLAHKFQGIFYCLGIHPCHINDSDESDLIKLKQCVIASFNDPKFVGIGEIGLDFFISEFNKEKMLWFFIEQLKIASSFNLPVVLHVRRSHDLTLKYLRKYKISNGIAHAFNGSDIQTKNFLRLGLLLGFGGSLTFERAKRIRKIALEIPDSAYVFETDSPDMSPSWISQEKKNSPAQIPRIVSSFASIRNNSISHVSQHAMKNICRVFPKLAFIN